MAKLPRHELPGIPEFPESPPMASGLSHYIGETPGGLPGGANFERRDVVPRAVAAGLFRVVCCVHDFSFRLHPKARQLERCRARS